VVASPSYIAAFEEDLALAASALRRPEHLLVISTPGPTSRGVLARHWVPASARLQAILGGARQSLHARVARHLLQRVRDEGSAALNAKELQGYYGRLIHRSAPLERLERTPMTDDEIRRFITRELHTEQRSCSATLRRLRDSGLACEQKRFSRLFHELRERP